MFYIRVVQVVCIYRLKENVFQTINRSDVIHKNHLKVLTYLNLLFSLLPTMLSAVDKSSGYHQNYTVFDDGKNDDGRCTILYIIPNKDSL